MKKKSKTYGRYYTRRTVEYYEKPLTIGGVEYDGHVEMVPVKKLVPVTFAERLNRLHRWAQDVLKAAGVPHVALVTGPGDDVIDGNVFTEYIDAVSIFKHDSVEDIAAMVLDAVATIRKHLDGTGPARVNDLHIEIMDLGMLFERAEYMKSMEISQRSAGKRRLNEWIRSEWIRQSAVAAGKIKSRQLWNAMRADQPEWVLAMGHDEMIYIDDHNRETEINFNAFKLRFFRMNKKN